MMSREFGDMESMGELQQHGNYDMQTKHEAARRTFWNLLHASSK